MDKPIKVGTIFIGNINHVKMKVVEIQGKNAIIQKIDTPKKFIYGLAALKHCDITIINQ